MSTKSKKFKSCCAPFCTNSQNRRKQIGVNGKILSYHKFPKSARQNARWASFCCFLNKIPADSVLCSDHFENKDISLENVINDSRVIRVLWPHAVPTIQTRKEKTPIRCAVRACNFSNTTTVVKHLFQFPKPSFHANSDMKLERLRQQRRTTWIHLLGRIGIPDSVIDTLAICSAHFVSGRPSHTSKIGSIDWSPSLHLSAPRLVKLPAKLQDNKPLINVKSTDFLIRKKQSSKTTTPNKQYVSPEVSIPKSSNMPITPVSTVSSTGRPFVTIRSNTPVNSSSLVTKMSTLPSIRLTPILAKHVVPSMQLDCLSEKTNFKELFVNGKLDHSQMGRTVKIDHVVNGVQQSFVLKLMEPPPSSNDEIILSDDIDDNFPPVKSPVMLSNVALVRRSKHTLTCNKRIGRIRRKILKKRNQYSYKAHVVRRLLQRSKNKLKKQSFKNLVLSYRTLQKNSMKIREDTNDCIIID